MREYAPEEAQELEDFAVKFAKDMLLAKAESDLQYFNAQLKKFYKANAVDKAAALKTSGTVAKYEAAADGLRDVIYGKLRELGEDAPEELQRQYGALKALERTFHHCEAVIAHPRRSRWRSSRLGRQREHKRRYIGYRSTRIRSAKPTCAGIA